MAIKFNPLTGNFDFTGSGGGGASYIDGEVATYTDLPLDGSAALNTAWLVREASGTWLIARKPAGIYIRTATAGVSRDADYTYAGILPDVFSDANFLLYDNADSTKNLAFQLSGITTGTTRTLTVPDASGTIALQGAITTSGLTQATARILGRTTASTGSIEEIQIGSGLSLSAGELSATGGDTVSIETSAADILSVASGAISADDAGADRIVFWDDSASKLAYLEAGSGLSLSGTTLTATATGTIGGGTGSTDNSILRSDGTGGSTLQASALVMSDFTNTTHPHVSIAPSVAGFSCTAATTDIITAVGHNFINDQLVTFTSLTGGAGLVINRPYNVRDVSGDTFKVAFSRGGGAVDITSAMTAGSVSSCVAIVLAPQLFGGIIGSVPDGTTAGGNGRGFGAVDLLTTRTAATQVASGLRSVLIGGDNNTASGDGGVVIGGSSCTASGLNRSGTFASDSSTASGSAAVVLGGSTNTASGGSSAVVAGFGNVASVDNAVAIGRAATANRWGMLAHGGSPFAAGGDAQRGHFVLKCKTTTNAAVEMFLDATTRLTIPSGKVMAMLINITGVKSDGSAVAHYMRQYAIKNVGGTTTEVYAPVTIGTDTTASTSILLEPNDTNDALKISCTGITSETWRWVASVDCVEVFYGT
jgi:hypothetical protein